MSYLQKQMNFLRFDKRLLEINLKNGILSQEEYDQFITDLKDSAGNAEKLELTDDNDSALDSMNGGSHSSENNDYQGQPATPPTNNDPFGSGF